MATSTSITNNKRVQAAQSAVDKATANYSNSSFSMSADTTAYKDKLNDLGEYESKYDGRINNTLSSIENGYDMNSDKLYQQYKQQYTREGLNASRDVSGQVASLNGGADSSMGRRQAAQAYYNYMQALNDKVPELANQWQQNQYNYLSALQSLDEADYQKYSDNREFYSSMFKDLYANDLTEYGYAQEKLYNLLCQANTNFSNTVSLEEWQAEFNQNAKQFGMEYALKKAESEANVANIKANTANTNANTKAIKASLNESSGSSSSSSKEKSTTGKSVSERYMALAQKINDAVKNGNTDDFKTKVNKAYKNGKISSDEKSMLLSNLSRAIALNEQSSSSSSSGSITDKIMSGAKQLLSAWNESKKLTDMESQIKQLINNMPTNGVGYANNYIYQQYEKGNITEAQCKKLLKYVTTI